VVVYYGKEYVLILRRLKIRCLICWDIVLGWNIMTMGMYR